MCTSVEYRLKNELCVHIYNDEYIDLKMSHVYIIIVTSIDLKMSHV